MLEETKNEKVNVEVTMMKGYFSSKLDIYKYLVE